MTTAAGNWGVRTTDTGPSVWERRLLLGATVLAVTAVAGIAGAISYGHMHDWSSANGEPPWRAQLFPLSVDGLLIAASVVLLADSRSGRKPDRLAYLLAGVGAAVSVAANVAHDWTHQVAETAIAGWPPLALLGSYELLMRLLRRLRPTRAQHETEAPATPDATPTAAAGTVGGPTAPSAPAAPSTRASERRSTAPGRPRRGPGTGSAGRDKAWAWWTSERAAGREPSGADVARVAGVDASLGRRWRRDWLRDETSPAPRTGPSAETKTTTTATGTTGESRSETDSDSETETTEEAA